MPSLDKITYIIMAILAGELITDTISYKIPHSSMYFDPSSGQISGLGFFMLLGLLTILMPIICYQIILKIRHLITRE